MAEISDEDYERLLRPLTKELSAMARWVAETRQRVVVLFEGRDTAGKGGSIDMIARVLNPRQCHVVALASPNERERAQWYFQRYAAHLPPKGEIALFDRSWYNRAGVEPVMGYYSEAYTDAFLRASPELERHLVEYGMLLYKYWLYCDQEKQELRFENRRRNQGVAWPYPEGRQTYPLGWDRDRRSTGGRSSG
jgi:polyphosphate kinase 2 (PPK2 family)